MPPSDASRPGEPTPSEDSPAQDALIREFVEHWGMMARSWGINPTMGELFALLYITGSDWTADELRERLKVSRGNVSMNLRELIAWGVVHKIHRQGERREFFRAEADVWTLFRRILSERKRRELDPTLVLLGKAARWTEDDPSVASFRDRIKALQTFFSLINALASRLNTLGPEDLPHLVELLDADSHADPDPGSAP